MTSELQIPIKVYTRRWLIMVIYLFYAADNAAQWIQFSVISNLVEKYFKVNENAVAWTSIVFMVTFLIFIFPATLMIEKSGLRACMVTGSSLMAAGSCIKALATFHKLYSLLMFGQTLTSITQAFMLNVPPHLAATWFGSDEVSTACAIGIFGNQAGIALGFVVPPALVKDSTDLMVIGSGLQLMTLLTAVLSVGIFLVTLVFFENRPPSPPSVEVASKNETTEGILKCVRRMLSQPTFALLLTSFSFIFAVINALLTFINEVTLRHFKSGAGRIGLLIIVGGMFGSVACGHVLDRTHAFKVCLVTLSVLLLVFFFAYSVAFQLASSVMVDVTATIFGACVTSYHVVAFEFSAELTYPEPEIVMCGLLLLPAQLTGISVTLAYGWLVTYVGDSYANVMLGAILLVNVGFTANVEQNLLRQQAHDRGLQNH